MLVAGLGTTKAAFAGPEGLGLVGFWAVTGPILSGSVSSKNSATLPMRPRHFANLCILSSSTCLKGGIISM